jgi:hypothetical protein
LCAALQHLIAEAESAATVSPDPNGF